MSHARWASQQEVEHPGRPSPGLVRLARRVEPLVRLLHRPTLEGAEHLPRERPFLLIANHSAGIAISELLTFVTTYLRVVGPDRRLAGVALPIGFRVFPVSAGLRAVGAVPSTFEAMRAALEQGVPLLVFPGGDHEGLRPVWNAHEVDFGGRLGFLRLARETRVPIVPMGIRGSSFTAPILLRARWLATLLVQPRLIGTKRWALSVLGVAVAAGLWWGLPLAWPWRALTIWWWLGSPLVFLPWVPWTLRFRIGEPLSAEELFGEEPSDEVLPRALARVESAVAVLANGD